MEVNNMSLKQKITENAKTASEIVHELLNERQRNFENFKRIRENKWVHKDDVEKAIDEATKQIQEIFDDTDKRAGDVRVISVVRDLKERVLAVLDGEKKEAKKE